MKSDADKILNTLFDPKESAELLKSKGLDMPVLIFLQTFGIIQRPANALLSVSTPILGLLFGSAATQEKLNGLLSAREIPVEAETLA